MGRIAGQTFLDSCLRGNDESDHLHGDRPLAVRGLIPVSRRIASEFIGTFGLVFAGTGAIVIDAVSGGVIGHLGVGMTSLD